MDREPTKDGDDMLDLIEEMLYERASKGVRPTLYISSYRDFECSLLMLLEDADAVEWTGQGHPVRKHPRYDVITN